MVWNCFPDGSQQDIPKQGWRQTQILILRPKSKNNVVFYKHWLSIFWLIWKISNYLHEEGSIRLQHSFNNCSSFSSSPTQNSTINPSARSSDSIDAQYLLLSFRCNLCHLHALHITRRVCPCLAVAQRGRKHFLRLWHSGHVDVSKDPTQWWQFTPFIVVE